MSIILSNTSSNEIEFYPEQGIVKTYYEDWDTDDCGEIYYKIVTNEYNMKVGEEIDEEDVDINPADAVYVEDMEMQKATKKSVRDYFNEHMK